MDANNEFDKLIKDKLAKSSLQVPSDMKDRIEKRLVKEGLIKRRSGSGGRWLMGSLAVIALLSIFAGGYYFSSDQKENVAKGKNQNEITNQETAEKIQEISDNNYEENSNKEIQKKNVVDIESNPGKVENKNAEIPVYGSNAGTEPINKLAETSVATSKTRERQKVERTNAHNIEQKVKSNNKMPDALTAGSERKISGKKKSVQDNFSSLEEMPDRKETSNTTVLNSGHSEDRKQLHPESTAKSDIEISTENSVINNGEGKPEVQGELSVEAENQTGAGNNSGTGEQDLHTGNNNQDVSSGNSVLQNDPAQQNLTAEDSVFKTDSSVTELPITSVDSAAKVSALSDSLFEDTLRVSRFSLEVFSGLQFTMKQGATYTNSKGNELSSAKSSEVIYGFKINYFINRFTLGTGLNYSKHISEIPSYYTFYYTDSTITSSVPVTLAGTVKTEFSIIDIPVLLGYNFQMNRFDVHVESGISFSFISDVSSSFVLEDTNLVINNLALVTPEKSFVNYVGQVSFLYSLSRKTKVFLQPSFNYGLQGIFREVPEEKINVFSLKAGLRFKF